MFNDDPIRLERKEVKKEISRGVSDGVLCKAMGLPKQKKVMEE